LDQGGNLLGTPEVGLVDNARLAVDSAASDKVVVELVGFFLSKQKALEEIWGASYIG
jgi:hypothetical protein